MDVKKFIKVTVLASGTVSVVPSANKAHYEQCNDLEKKAKKNPIYKIEEPKEDEVVKYYPELASGKTVKTVTVDDHTKAIEAKDAEIKKLKEELSKQNNVKK